MLRARARPHGIVLFALLGLCVLVAPRPALAERQGAGAGRDPVTARLAPPNARRTAASTGVGLAVVGAMLVPAGALLAGTCGGAGLDAPCGGAQGMTASIVLGAGAGSLLAGAILVLLLPPSRPPARSTLAATSGAGPRALAVAFRF